MTPGTVVSGRWRILHLLRAGADSRVYLARDREDRTDAVLKARAPRSSQAPEPQMVLDAFPVTAVQHPNVVTALEGGVGADGAPWVALEALEGATLRDRVRAGGPLPAAVAAEILANVAVGLAAIHDRGLVHGSLDAAGVFLARGRTSRGGDRCVILDFPPCPTGGPDGERRVEPAGGAIPFDVPSDLHALGAVAWECLAGRPPFSGDSRRARRLPVPLTLLPDGPIVPPDMDDFILRLLSRDPSRRPSTAREAADRFLRWRPGTSPGRDRGQPAGRGQERGSGEPVQRVALHEPAVAYRGTEMRRLARVLDEAQEGRGAVLWMEGDEGGGKSTLGRRFLSLAEDRGFRVGSGRAVPDHRLSGWLEALVAAGLAPGRDPASAVPVQGCLEQAVSERPLALFLDDFHAADPVSADLLDRVALRVADRPLPLAVLVSSRPLARLPAGDEAALHRALATVRGLGNAWRLPGMTDREIDAVTAAMSRRPFDPNLRALVRRAAAGNPMIAVHVLRHLEAEGVLIVVDGRISLAPGGAALVPEGLRQVMTARLEGLKRSEEGPAVAEILDRVVLLGRHATPTNLKALLGLERRDDLVARLAPALERMVREGYLREVPWRPEAFLVPVHAGLREVLEAERHGPDSARTHLAAARVLEALAAGDAPRVAADLADHYERAGFLDGSIEWLHRAAGRASEEGDVVRARNLLLRAEGHLDRLGLPADPRRPDILLDLANCEVFGGRHAQAARVLASLERECPPAPRSRAARRLLEVQARLEECRRHPEAAAGHLLRLSAEAREAGDAGMEARALMRLACLQMDRGDNRGAETSVREAAEVLKDAGECGDRGCLDLVRGRLLRKMGQVSEALDCLDRALGLLTDPREFPERTEAMFFRSACLMDQDRNVEAEEVCRVGAALCEQAGYPRGLAAHLTNLSVCLGRTGRADEGLEVARRSLEIRERMGDSRGLAHVLTALADLAIPRRDWETVKDLSDKALALSRQGGYVQGERVALLNLARAWNGLGDVAEARRSLEACLMTARRDDALSLALANAHLFLADLLAAGGEREAALRHRLSAVVVLEKIQRPDRANAVRKTLGAATGGAGGPKGS